MPLSTINTPPALDSFTSLTDHQSQTPSTFYDARPVLHFHAVGVRAVTASEYVKDLPFFSDGPSNEGGPAVETVDAYISTDNVTLFNTTTATGLSIPYPNISLHAIQRLEDPADSAKKEVPGLFMQIETPPKEGEEDMPSVIELALIPSDPDTTTQQLYEAVTNCSNLVPDEDEEMEDVHNNRIVVEGLSGIERGTPDGSLPPPFPGSGGWITAENVGEYFDADGNWIGGGEGEEVESLGEGAGRVRGHDEVDGEDVQNGTNGDDEEANKRPRTD
ncbi:hypothetical protein ACMFMG_004103 [Clarireedia jacksonii]